MNWTVVTLIVVGIALMALAGRIRSRAVSRRAQLASRTPPPGLSPIQENQGAPASVAREREHRDQGAERGEAGKNPRPPAGNEASSRMETLSEATARLALAGFRDSFQARSEGLYALDAGRLLAPEELEVVEVVRFEGESDPEDEAVLFALVSRDEKVRGTFIANYGSQTGPECAEMMKRLDAAARKRGGAGA